MELQLEELEADATEDDLMAEEAAARTTTVIAFERKRPARKPFPDHLPRERVVLPAPCSCPACGGDRLSKLGEDVTETLEVIPRSWKVIQTVREKFSCWDCEKIAHAPAPFHVVPRGWAGPSFLAMLLFEKCGQHQPLNRQADRFAREGVPLSVSTLADQVGAAAFALMPLYKLIEAHVLAATRLHGDDTTVPVMAKGKTDPVDFGSMRETIVLSQAPIRAQPFSITLPIGAANSRDPISPRGPVSCKPMPMEDMASSTTRAAPLRLSSKLAALPMRGASSSSSPMSRVLRAARVAASSAA